MNSNVIDFVAFLEKKREKSILDAVRGLDFSTHGAKIATPRDGQQMIEKLTSVIAACESHIALSAGVN